MTIYQYDKSFFLGLDGMEANVFKHNNSCYYVELARDNVYRKSVQICRQALPLCNDFIIIKTH